jgi:hypothetical protein
MINKIYCVADFLGNEDHRAIAFHFDTYTSWEEDDYGQKHDIVNLKLTHVVIGDETMTPDQAADFLGKNVIDAVTNETAYGE